MLSLVILACKFYALSAPECKILLVKLQKFSLCITPDPEAEGDTAPHPLPRAFCAGEGASGPGSAVSKSGSVPSFFRTDWRPCHK